MRGIIIFRIGSLVGSTFCLTYLLNLPNILYSFACGESETDEQSFGGVHSNLESLGVYGWHHRDLSRLINTPWIYGILSTGSYVNVVPMKRAEGDRLWNLVIHNDAQHWAF